MDAPSTDLAVPAELLDVDSGQLLPATVENAAAVLNAARAMKQRIQGVVDAATAYLTAEAAVLGTKTFHYPGGTVALTGGESLEYDHEELMGLLHDAGLPLERVAEAVVTEVTYKVNRSVLRQLAGANPDYRAAIELAERRVEKPYRASVKPR